MTEAIRDYVLTAHARFEMERRSISEDIVRQVLAAPEQRVTVRPGREVLQSRIHLENRLYLVRIFVDLDRELAEVVTAYRTSKIEKYWRNEP